MGLVLEGGSIGGLSPGGIPLGAEALGPAFSAVGGTSQAMTSSAFTKMVLATEERDTHGAYNHSAAVVGGIPAYAFQPSVAGWYRISFAVGVTAAATALIASVYKNGARHKDASGAGSQFISSGSADVYLDGDDWVELYCYHESGATRTTTTPAFNNYFQASYIGP